MHLNPYGQYAVALAVDLLNDPPTGVAELARRVREAEIVLVPPATDEDVVAVRALLAAFAGVVDARDGAERAERLNDLLAAHAAHPRMVDHSGAGWHLHYRADGLSLSGVVAAIIAVGTALHLAGRGMHRLGRCSADDCDRAFADVSRTGRQRYCGNRCANRDAVRRHRSRTRVAG